MPDCARREAPVNEEVKFIRGNDCINLWVPEIVSSGPELGFLLRV